MATATMIDINTIVETLKRASDAYYNGGDPVMTDAEFDKLRDKLEELDPQNAFLTEVGAPKPSSVLGWPTHKHRVLMGSLAKVKTKEEFDKWAEGKGDEFLLSEKYDGSTVVATYKNGKLRTLATRGDGTEGENITPNAKQIKNVPADLGHDFSGEIRGEALLKISLFDKYFRPDGHSNPRNTSNGKVRDMKDNPLKSHIEVFWFDILPVDRDLKTEQDKWTLLHELGLSKHLTGKTLNAEEVWGVFTLYRDPFPNDPALNGDTRSLRQRLDYEIDGLVIKVNDLELQESFGITSNRPKGSLAIKFPSIEKQTIITDIVWSRGLTGVISPVAHLAPIEVGGVTIAKASLCGIEEIQRLGVGVGDTVIISRRNDVIPKVERVVSQVAGRADHQPPTHCELCQEELTRDGAYIVCLNEECQGEIYGNLMTWIKELKIKGFGPSMVRALIQEDIKDVPGLYTAGLDVFNRAAGSEKNGQRRYDALHAAGKDLRLSTFLPALNIRALGSTNGQRLEKKFKNLDGVLAATNEELQEIPGIKTNAKKIHGGLQKNIELIRTLAGLLTIKALDESGPLAGKSFCITGDLSMPRPKIHDWIKDQGGEVKGGVSKTLSYLVTSDPDSGTGKNKKADKYGVSKISEEDLYGIAGCRP
ncbi:MAG: BRCT domain-containing protein [Candidatus Thorarchaeota archaeon]|jgi:DNA ligase (NAD+)